MATGGRDLGSSRVRNIGIVAHINAGKTTEVWTRFTWPIIDTIPPFAMGLGLDLAAFLRRIKPTRDRFARAYRRVGGA